MMKQFWSIPQLVKAEQMQVDEIAGRTPEGTPFVIHKGTWKVEFDSHPGHVALFTDADFKKNFTEAEQDDSTPAPETVVSDLPKDEKKANILIVSPGT